MLRDGLARLADSILRAPRTLLAASAVLTAVSLILASGLELRTSRRELAPGSDPDQRRFREILQEFSGPDPLVVAVEAAPGSGREPAGLGPVVEELARVLSEAPEVDHVFYGVDPEWLFDHALHLVPASALAQVASMLERMAADGPRWIPASWPELNDELAARVRAGLSELAPVTGTTSREALDVLDRLLSVQQRFLDDPALFDVDTGTDLVPHLLARQGGRLAAGGRLASHDGDTLYLLVAPADEDDSLAAHRRLVEASRSRIAAALDAHPGVTVGLTGHPALVVDEMASVRADTRRTSLLAIAAVSGLALLAFRWRAHALIAVSVLAAGVSWSLGAVRLELGYLNLLTSAFLSALVGVGIAYAIHPISEYELCGAHEKGADDAVRSAYHRTGAAVVVSGVTTAGAFFAIMLMDFRGFREMGLVAGTGVLLCLAAVLVTLPALLVVTGRLRAATARRASVPRRAAPVVDRLWLDAAARHVCRAPRTATLAVAAVTLAAGLLATGLRFEHDIVDLLPRGAESHRYLRMMIERSDVSPRTNLVVAGSLGELEAFADRAAREPEIDRFESVLDLLPAGDDAARAELARVRDGLAALDVPATAPSWTAERLAASLGALVGAIDAASEAAFVSGDSETTSRLAALRDVPERLRDTALSASPARVEDWRHAEARLRTLVGEALERARRAASSEPPALDDLPAGVRDRLVTKSGRYLGVVHPKGDVFDPVFLAAFNEASRRVSADAAGFPINFEKMSARITGGFLRAFLAGALLVFVVLLVDFRSLTDALTAMLPLVAGVVWLLGAMRLAGLSFNLANLIALPLILGIGIDNGVHVVHRLRLEGREGMTTVLRHTGRAILVSSLATMVGFGSLSLASHRGLASLGMILVLGIGGCFLTATVALPNLLVALGRARP